MPIRKRQSSKEFVGHEIPSRYLKMAFASEIRRKTDTVTPQDNVLLLGVLLGDFGDGIAKGCFVYVEGNRMIDERRTIRGVNEPPSDRRKMSSWLESVPENAWAQSCATRGVKHPRLCNYCQFAHWRSSSCRQPRLAGFLDVEAAARWNKYGEPAYPRQLALQA
jgi:hypothetical protein